MKRFLSILTSEKGPITPSDKKLFQEILAFFSAEGPRQQPQEDQKVSNKQQQLCYQIKDNVRTEESLEDILDWDDSLPVSNDDDANGHDSENLIPSKRVKSKSKKIKSIVIHKETNITGTTLKIPPLAKLEFGLLHKAPTHLQYFLKCPHYVFRSRKNEIL